MAKSKFPEKLFIKCENKGTEDEYLSADPCMDKLAEDDPTLIAEYKLVGTRKLKKVVVDVE